MLKTAFLAAIAFACLLSPAQARHRHHIAAVVQPACTGWFCWSAPPAQASTRSEVVGGRPAGCPHAFCGCGASLHLFGRIIPSLNLAANWLRFPRAAPAPKMAAVRPHHVFVLEQHLGGNVWLAYDANSGGHATRLHARSIAGYTIVNPTGGA